MPSRRKEVRCLQGGWTLARSPLCTGSVNANTQGRATTRRVEEQDRHQDDSSDSEEDRVVKRVTMVDTMQGRNWPGVQGQEEETLHIKQVEEIRQVHQAKHGSRKSRYVRVRLNGHRVKLFCDTGSSRLTIIPPDMYRDDMGELVAAGCHLRAWGSDKYLNTKGMFKTMIKAAGGASKQMRV